MLSDMQKIHHLTYLDQLFARKSATNTELSERIWMDSTGYSGVSVVTLVEYLNFFMEIVLVTESD